jgi:hypothetical protein
MHQVLLILALITYTHKKPIINKNKIAHIKTIMNMKKLHTWNQNAQNAQNLIEFQHLEKHMSK